MTRRRDLVWVLLSVSAASSSAYGQDRRSVSEPAFPATCVTLQAPLSSTTRGPVIGESAIEQDTESAAETQIIANAVAQCAPGQAVELALGHRSSNNAFLIDPLVIPRGVSLIIDGGVTVYASRDPANFQDPTTPTILCGTIGDYKVNQGCKPLLTLAANSGVYGYGILDGQGNRTSLSGENAGQTSWWDLLGQKKGCNQAASTASSSCQQASPLMVSTGNVPSDGSPNSGLTLYKITIRNPPFHTVNLGGTAVTVWGVKVQLPWNIANTDGFDVHGTDITIYDSIVANGDQDIAFTSNTTPTINITVDHFRAYGKGGIALLDDGVGISDLLIQNTLITGDLPSVAGTTVNGVTQRVLKTSMAFKATVRRCRTRPMTFMLYRSTRTLTMPPRPNRQGRFQQSPSSRSVSTTSKYQSTSVSWPGLPRRSLPTCSRRSVVSRFGTFTCLPPRRNFQS